MKKRRHPMAEDLCDMLQRHVFAAAQVYPDETHFPKGQEDEIHRSHLSIYYGVSFSEKPSSCSYQDFLAEYGGSYCDPQIMKEIFLKNGWPLHFPTLRTWIIKSGGSITNIFQMGRDVFFGAMPNNTQIPFSHNFMYLRGREGYQDKIKEEIKEFLDAPSSDELGDVITSFFSVMLQRQHKPGLVNEFLFYLRMFFPDTWNKYKGRSTLMDRFSEHTQSPMKGLTHWSPVGTKTILIQGVPEEFFSLTSTKRKIGNANYTKLIYMFRRRLAPIENAIADTIIGPPSKTTEVYLADWIGTRYDPEPIYRQNFAGTDPANRFSIYIDELGPQDEDFMAAVFPQYKGRFKKNGDGKVIGVDTFVPILPRMQFREGALYPNARYLDMVLDNV